jgi:hypothetical protein
MNANLQRYMMVLSLGVRLALATANAAAQHLPESQPAVSAVPPPPAGSSGARSISAGSDEATRAGQVISGRWPLDLSIFERRTAPAEAA